MNIRCILSCGFVIMIYSAFSQTNWQLSKDKNGIKVYTANNNGSAVKSIRVDANLTGSMQKLINILTDVDNNKKWVYHTKHSYLIKKVSPTEILYYAETSLPLLNNRDMAISMQFYLDTLNNRLKVKATAIPDAVPLKRDIVRIRHFNGLWDVKSEGNNKIIIQYWLNMDPGGSIPPAISNLFISKGPYETFNNLSKLLKQ